jgi:flagellin
MALAIATNNAALNAAASASSVNRDMETSMARLSSGKRINSASDDAAGVAIASRLSSEIRGTDQAIRNSLDGQALIDTAEGAHKEIENILQRMREIAVQAANDTNNDQDRANLQAEMDAMVTEIDRIAETTTWAGTNLMQANTSTFEFQVGTATGEANQIEVNISGMTASDLNLTDSAATAYSAEGKITVTSVAENGTASAPSVIITDTDTTDDAATIQIAAPATDFTQADTHTISLEGISVTLVGTIDADLDTIDAAWGHLGVKASAVAATVSGTDYSLAANDGADYISLAFTDVNSPENLSVMSTNAQNLAVDATNNTGLTTDADANARDAIKNIDAAIMTVNNQRSELGAVSNRLNHTVNNLTNISSNLSAAKGGIEDTDFAVETTNLAKHQILQQASTAMLAQANASKQNVLALLRS